MFHTSDNSYTSEELGKAIKILREAYSFAINHNSLPTSKCVSHILYKLLPALYKMVSGENLDE